MLATKRQIEYLQHLTDRAEYIKQRHPGLIPCGLFHTTWGLGMTSADASARIAYYQNILGAADKLLYRRRVVSENEN